MVNLKNNHEISAENSTIVADVLYPDSEQTQAAPEADAETPSLERSLGLVAIHNKSLQDASDALNAQVLRARASGATWLQIANATGISVQAAHQRWSETGRQRHRERQARHQGTPTDTPE